MSESTSTESPPDKSPPVQSPPVESPPPGAMPANDPLPDLRTRLRDLARELIRTRNRRALTEYLQLRRRLAA